MTGAPKPPRIVPESATAESCSLHVMMADPAELTASRITLPATEAGSTACTAVQLPPAERLAV